MKRFPAANALNKHLYRARSFNHPNRLNHLWLIAAASLLTGFAQTSMANIYEWETFIDPITNDESIVESNILLSTTTPQPNSTFANEDLIKAYLANADFSGSSLEGMDFTNSYLAGANLNNTTISQGFLPNGFRNPTFANADLSDTTWQGASWNSTFSLFQNAKIDRADFSQSDITPDNIYQTANYQSGSLTDMKFNDIIISNIDLSNKDLSRTQFRQTRLTGNLQSSTLNQADFADSYLLHVNFDQANLANASFYSTRFHQVDFGYTDLIGVDFTDAEPDRTDFSRTNLNETQIRQFMNLDRIILNDFDLSGMNLSGREFNDANLRNVNFTNADITDAEFEGADLTGIQGMTHAQWVTNIHSGYPRRLLRDAVLDGAQFFAGHSLEMDMENVSFADANFEGTTIGNPGLYTSNNYDMNFHAPGANFRSAIVTNGLTGTPDQFLDFTNADFTNAELRNVNNQYIDLTGSDLSGAVITGRHEDIIYTDTNLTGAQIPISESNPITNADFANANLTNARFGNTNTDYRPPFPLAVMTNVDFTNATIDGLRMDFIRWDNVKMTRQQFETTNILDGKVSENIMLRNMVLNGWVFDNNDPNTPQTFSFDFQGSEVIDMDFRNTGGLFFEWWESLDNSLSTYERTIDFTNAIVRNSDWSGERTAHDLWNGRTSSLPVFNSRVILENAELHSITLTNQNFEYDKDDNHTTRSVIKTGFNVKSVTNSDFSGSSFNRMPIYGTWTNVNLSNSNMEYGDMTRASFHNVDFRGSYLFTTSFADATNSNFTDADLRAATFTTTVAGSNFTNARLNRAVFQNVDMTSAILTGANLNNAVLENVDMTGARLTGANLNNTVALGFTAEQLYSTASYQSGDMRNVVWSNNDLTDWDLTNLNLTNTNFKNTTGVDLSKSDIRGAINTRYHRPFRHGPVTNGTTIEYDGVISRLRVGPNEHRIIWDHNHFSNDTGFSIHVWDSFAIDEAGTLELRFEDKYWSSTIKVSLFAFNSFRGKLLLSLDDKLTLDDLLDWDGTTFHIFDQSLRRTGPAPSHVIYNGPYGYFDLTNLDSTGEITFHIPAPATYTYLLFTLLLISKRSQRNRVHQHQAA